MNELEYAKSKHVQQFKIGRIRYNLPQSVTYKGRTCLLFFRLTGSLEWVSGYRPMLSFSTKEELVVSRENSFNRSVKAIYKAMKNVPE